MSGPGKSTTPQSPGIDLDFLHVTQVRKRMEAAYAEMRRRGQALTSEQERTLIRLVLP